MKKQQIRNSHFFSQTQETEITLSRKTSNISKKAKIISKSYHKIKKATKGIAKSPAKQSFLIPESAMEEIEPSPLSSKYATLSKTNIETFPGSQSYKSAKKLNFFTQ
ncbi:hypothetical protein EHP00_1871 [Ecytonucleospora hepatopenaei]|uniref:Uncharacterized protein n=1 Tax=Ecytonucleospora hepatopenaei TaxID=646526 RepID=A0A1W0E8C4_9MICR|nr:hypothetical protein EHP00_1871 [Ecytonucleospora hepatopenaei]